MTRICYVNGAYVPAPEAQVSMWDRGHQYGDGIYEVALFFNRRFLDADKHLERMRRSLDAVRISFTMSDVALRAVMEELVSRHALEHGYIYFQITRGSAPRAHPFPKSAKPNLTMFVMPLKEPTRKEFEEGIRVISTPDLRWQRCDVKTVALLPNVLARQLAAEAGAREVFLVDAEGMVTEGALSNAYIVRGGTIITHAADHHILNGVRRQVMTALARSEGIPVDEGGFHIEDARKADEAFMSSASSHVLPVTMLDNQPIGAGRPGPVTLRLLAAYKAYVTAATGRVWPWYSVL